MGGNALKNCTCRRISKAVYFVLRDEVLNILHAHFLLADVPPTYNSKEDFGDLDVLVASPLPRVNPKNGQLETPNFDVVYQKIAENFHSQEVVINGHCRSFEFKEFQIDIIPCTAPFFEMHLAYLMQGDLGKIIGIISSRIGLEYYEHGLKVRLLKDDDPTKYLGTIELCHEPKAVFQYLGFDFERILRGFDTIYEIFDMCIASHYFDPRFFRMKVFNYNFRKKTSKRGMYMKFLDYLLEKFPDSDESKPKINISMDAIQRFNKLHEYQEIMEKYSYKANINEKFNGKVVSLVLGITGKELGDFLKAIKSEKGFEERIASMTKEEIEGFISRSYNNMKKEGYQEEMEKKIEKNDEGGLLFLN